MHPTTARELPADQQNWAFEPKWDGYRALAHLVGGERALRSRNGVDMAGWFPELAGLGRAIGERAAVLDREVVAVDADGRPSFGALQQRMAGPGERRHRLPGRPGDLKVLQPPPPLGDGQAGEQPAVQPQQVEDQEGDGGPAAPAVAPDPPRTRIHG